MIVGRWADKDNCYQMIANWSTSSLGVITISRRIAGTSVILYTSPRDSFVSGDVMRLVIKEEAGGTRLSAYVGAVLLINFIDNDPSRPAASTRAGFAEVPNGVLSGNARFDNFAALIP